MAISTFMTIPTGREGLKSFVCDATISVAPKFSNTITEHPVEKAATISDHAYNNNPTIAIHGIVSNSFTPAEFAEFDSLRAVDNEIGYTVNRVQVAYDLLKELWRSRGEFRIISEYDEYSPCILKSFSTTFDKENSDVLNFNITATQIRQATTSKTLVVVRADSVKEDSEGKKAKNENKKELEITADTPISEVFGAVSDVWSERWDNWTDLLSGEEHRTR